MEIMREAFEKKFGLPPEEEQREQYEAAWRGWLSAIEASAKREPDFYAFRNGKFGTWETCSKQMWESKAQFHHSWEWKELYFLTPLAPAPTNIPVDVQERLVRLEELNKVSATRLAYLYQQMNKALVVPLMTLDQWLVAIDRETFVLPTLPPTAPIVRLSTTKSLPQPKAKR